MVEAEELGGELFHALLLLLTCWFRYFLFNQQC